MDQLLPVLAVASCAAVIFALVSAIQRFSPRELPWLVAGLVAHMAASFAVVAVTRAAYGSGDMFAYFYVAESLQPALHLDFTGTVKELFILIFHGRPVLPAHLFGVGSPTGTMIGVTTLIDFAVGGSLYGTCLVIASISFFGKLALYIWGRESFPERYRPRLAFGVLLVPTVVFWSGGIIKESFAVAGIGFLALALHRILQRRVVVGALIGLIGFGMVALIKPYLLFAFVMSAGAFLYARNALSEANGHRLEIRPLHLVVAVALAVGGLIVLGKLFPNYSFENIGAEAALQQGAGAKVTGGSSYSIGDSNATSLTGQLAFAPVGLIYSLFRPFIFEVRNVQMAVNALEALALTVLFFRVFWIRSWRASWRMLTSSPALIFAATFVLIVGVGVGIATTNVGTLSRFRMPMMPFYAMLLLVMTIGPLPARKAEPEEVLPGKVTWLPNSRPEGNR
ncbi:MAG: hypothetical protein AAGF12_19040 [Myxococcota bacterium]